MVRRLLSHLPIRGRLLDYGCGLGDLTYQLAPMFEETIGVDVTPERIAWANGEFHPVKFYMCNETELDYPDNDFDVVLSSVVINWVDNPHSYLQRIHRVLVRNGHLVILVKAPDAVRNFFRMLLNKHPGPQGFEIDSMTKMLKVLGFRIIDADCYYDPLIDLINNPKSILVELVKLPMRLFKMKKYAQYYGIIAMKI